MSITLESAAALVNREAWLLDRGQFDAWLDLYTADATYWVPLEPDQVSPIDTQSIIYDDRRLMALRVRQTRHPRAHARTPSSRTVHQVSNILLGERLQSGECVVDSVLVVIEFRAERQRVFGATVEHRLRATEQGLRIVAKRINLVNADAELDGIQFLF